MSPGKAIAQAGHAYLGVLAKSASVSPPEHSAYTSLDVATKICLNGGSGDNLLLPHQKGASKNCRNAAVGV